MFSQITPFSYYANSRWGSVLDLRVLLLVIGVMCWLGIRQLRAEPKKLQPGRHGWLAAIVFGLLLHAVLWRAHLATPRLVVLHALVFCSIGWLGGWILVRRFLLPLILLAPLFLPRLGMEADYLQTRLYNNFPLVEARPFSESHLRPRRTPVEPVASIPVHPGTVRFLHRLEDILPAGGTMIVITGLAICFCGKSASRTGMVLSTGGLLTLLCAWIQGMTIDC